MHIVSEGVFRIAGAMMPLLILSFWFGQCQSHSNAHGMSGHVLYCWSPQDGRSNDALVDTILLVWAVSIS